VAKTRRQYWIIFIHNTLYATQTTNVIVMRRLQAKCRLV